MEFDRLHQNACNMLATLQPLGVGLIYNDIKGNVDKLSRHAGKYITTDLPDWVEQYRPQGIGGEHPFTWLCWLKWASELIRVACELVLHQKKDAKEALSLAYSKTLIHRHNLMAQTMAKATFSMMKFNTDVEWDQLYESSSEVCSLIGVYIE
jgi:hypothetical protein